jgi:hypothetical protein
MTQTLEDSHEKTHTRTARKLLVDFQSLREGASEGRTENRTILLPAGVSVARSLRGERLG